VNADAQPGRSGDAPPISLVLVAAIAENGVIGRDNQLPWRLKSDMRHFRRLTMGHPVVMGRTTFQSLFKPLQGRTMIVVTRDRSFAGTGAVVAASVEAALAAARGDALRRGSDAIFVAGGAEIYRQVMAFADRLVITLVHDRPEGDALFPAIDQTVWHEVERAEPAPAPGDSARFSFLSYERNPDSKASTRSHAAGEARSRPHVGITVGAA
jgi:dihydrofolate reductase